MEQEPYRGFDIPLDDFADNPDPRVPCVLLLDSSYSMSGQPINELNAGLLQYREELLSDHLAARRVEVALFSFGGHVSLNTDFVTSNAFSPPTLVPNGNTPMAEAIMRGITHLEARKAIYNANGIAYYRPWVFLITDGAPTDDASSWALACDAVCRGEQAKKFMFFAVGTADADFAKLREVSPVRPPMQLKGLAFSELFRWLSNSQSRVSQSQVGDNIALPPATGEDGWAIVPT